MKKKILTGLLCAILIGPLSACDNGNTSSDDTINGGGAGGGNTATEVKVQEKLEDALIATKSKLADVLNKDLFSFNLGVQNDMVIESKEEIIEYIVNEDCEAEITGRNTYNAREHDTMNASIVANFDLKYLDALMKQEEALPENLSEVYTKINSYNIHEREGQKVKEYRDETESYLKGFSVIEKESWSEYYHDPLQEGQESIDDFNEYYDVYEADLEIFHYLSIIFSEINKVLSFDSEQLLDYVLNLLPSEDEKPEFSTFSDLFNKDTVKKVLNFLKGTVTSNEFADYILVDFLKIPGEEITVELKSFVGALLDYVKTINVHSLFNFSDKNNLITIEFNYEAFKTLLGKLIDDLANLIENSKIEQFATMDDELRNNKQYILESLAKNIEVKVSFEIKNKVIVSTAIDFLLEGEITPLFGLAKKPLEPGETFTETEEILTKIDYSQELTMEFANIAYEVPVLTVPVE